LLGLSAWTTIGVLVFVVVPALLLLELLRYVYLEYRRDRVPILLYHRLIRQEDAERGLVPDEEMIWASYDTRFAEQMRYLRDAGYTTLDLDDYLRIREGRMPLPARAVVVTFDDGYLSNYTYAYPVLKSLGQKATIFVAPEPDEHTRELVRGLDGFLSDEQMREMAANGISIQSHTLTHCILSELDDEAAMRELTESRKRLAAVTGKAVEHIAIPRSGYSRRIRRLVREAGYRTACGNNKGTANGRSNLLALPRIVIERDMTVEDFARCLTPRGSLVLRILGNLKRIPERIGGASFAVRVRDALYGGRLRPLFAARNLKRMLIVFVLLYAICGALFVWHLVRST